MAITLLENVSGSVPSQVFDTNRTRFGITADFASGEVVIECTNDPRGKTDPDNAAWYPVSDGTNLTAGFSADIDSELEFYRIRPIGVAACNVWVSGSIKLITVP